MLVSDIQNLRKCLLTKMALNANHQLYMNETMFVTIKSNQLCSSTQYLPRASHALNDRQQTVIFIFPEISLCLFLPWIIVCKWRKVQSYRHKFKASFIALCLYLYIIHIFWPWARNDLKRSQNEQTIDFESKQSFNICIWRSWDSK